MSTRFTTVAGFLAAGVLLSGSAFAFAPEFTEDLPTVIITDKLPAAQQSGLAVYDVNGLPSNSTAYVFRVSQAFDAAGYIDVNGNDFNQIKFRFTESNYDDVNGPAASVNAAGTLLISGETASAAVPAAGDFTTAPNINNRYTSSDAKLDFRNIDFSGSNEGVNAGFDAIGGVTGQNIDLSDPQKRWVDLYIKGNTSADIEVGGFLVITTRNGEDGLATSPASSNPYTVDYSADVFQGWVSGAINDLFAVPTSGTNFTAVAGGGVSGGFTFTPSTTPTPAPGAATLALSSTATKVGLANWGLPAASSGITLQANRLYRLRADIYSPVTTSKEDLRIGFGEAAGTTGQGFVTYLSSVSSFITNNPIVPPTAAGSDTVAYLVPRATGPSLIQVDIITQNAGGQDYVLESVEIASADLSELGSSNVVLNRGGTFTAAAGEVMPNVASPTAFVTTAGQIGQTVNGVKLNSSTNPTISVTGSALSLTYLSGDNENDFAAFGFATSNSSAADAAQGAFAGTNGKLYLIDVWASTTTPSVNDRPQLRTSVAAGITLQAQTLYEVDNDNPANALTANAKAFTTGLYLNDPARPAANSSRVNIDIQLLSFSRNYTGNSNTTINRITVREFEAFLD